jgi:hypothetical protein
MRGKVALEGRERSRVGGRAPEADVAVGADQDHTACRDAGAGGTDTGVVRSPHELGHFSERRQGEVRRVDLPRTPVDSIQ